MRSDHVVDKNLFLRMECWYLAAHIIEPNAALYMYANATLVGF